jgi:organic radical activating enzyme
MIKTRVFPEHNYKGIHFNGKTIRVALDPNKPIDELDYPEFYDVKVTSFCKGNCPWCYQNSLQTVKHPKNIIQRFISFFGGLTENQKPFQIAFGGGEPTTHPDFPNLMKTSYDMGIVPNYTTNGMWVDFPEDKKQEILHVSKNYCGGVAISTHPHLERYWREAVNIYLDNKIFTNLHIIIGDKKTVDKFKSVYNEFHGKVKYFVLLPLTAQGRAKESFVDWDYFQKSIEGNPEDVAFGANFYPYLMKDPGRFKVSLYEPELMSKYLDLETMNIYPSSFSNKVIKNVSK